MANYFRYELSTARAAALRAAALCRSQSPRSIPRLSKTCDSSPATALDYACQVLIAVAISARFPQDQIVAEETSLDLELPENEETLVTALDLVSRAGIDLSRRQFMELLDSCRPIEPSTRYWTIDPIDGTKSYLRGDQYAVCIALVIDSCPVVSVIAGPMMQSAVLKPNEPGCVYTAVAGLGAFVSSLRGRESVPLGVSSRSQPSELRCSQSFAADYVESSLLRNLLSKLGNSLSPRCLESQLKYALVADGSVEFFLRNPAFRGRRFACWDHAAGLLLVKEAGGTVSGVTGRPISVGPGVFLSEDQGILASNGLVHDLLLDALARSRSGTPPNHQSP